MTHRRTRIAQALQAPALHDALRLVFQPIFDLRTGEVIANEALARWTHPVLGAIPPSEFVPIAEQLDLIGPINQHLMRLAFDAAVAWPRDIQLSFNLSAVQLSDPALWKTILRLLEGTGLAATRLQLEVTETALLADFERARANLHHLKAAGATIVLDDFGAGYASIVYLRELRFDQIKLDGGLVNAAKDGADGRRLLRAVIALCDVLNVSTVAEQVDSREILRLVRELGCTAGQGYWLGRPSRRARCTASIRCHGLPRSTALRDKPPRPTGTTLSCPGEAAASI